jgi:hypothetical protein
LTCVVFQLYPTTSGCAYTPPLVYPRVWHSFAPHVPKLPPPPATTASAAVPYVNATPPARKFTVPFACVVAVCAFNPWQCVQLVTCPNSTLEFRCAWCACVVIVADVLPWHSEQLFVPPPSTVPHVYGESAGPACPLLWQLFTPQEPNDAPTVIPRLPVYTASPVITAPPKLTDAFRCVAAEPAA